MCERERETDVYCDVVFDGGVVGRRLLRWRTRIGTTDRVTEWLTSSEGYTYT